MNDQKGASVTATVLPHSEVIDWDNYFKEKMVELRRLVDERDKNLDISLSKKKG
jgi:hypothetical protein